MSKRILDKIHKHHDLYTESIKDLQNILAPYLEEYLQGETPHISVRSDEDGGIFIVDSTSHIPSLYHLDDDHIKFIKKHKKINTDLTGR